MPRRVLPLRRGARPRDGARLGRLARLGVERAARGRAEQVEGGLGPRVEDLVAALAERREPEWCVVVWCHTGVRVSPERAAFFVFSKSSRCRPKTGRTEFSPPTPAEDGDAGIRHEAAVLRAHEVLEGERRRRGRPRHDVRRVRQLARAAQRLARRGVLGPLERVGVCVCVCVCVCLCACRSIRKWKRQPLPRGIEVCVLCGVRAAQREGVEERGLLASIRRVCVCVRGDGGGTLSSSLDARRGSVLVCVLCV